MVSRALWSLVLLSALGSAQDLSVPTTWRKYSDSHTLDQRISIAQAGINQITAQLDSSNGQFNGIGYWQSGNVWSAVANNDHIAGVTTNQAAVTSGLNTAFNLYANYDQYGYNDDALWWATAAYYAYRAYGDSNLLSHAITTWNNVQQYQITPDQAQAGSTPVKSFGIEGTCDGQTTAGGVFWRPNADDAGMNSITTGLFLTLSAYLAEETGDDKYTTAATLAANWIKNHNINSDNIVLDSEAPSDCSRSSASWLFTYNSGKYIEGLSVLSAVTGDTSWNDLAITIIAAATHTSAWQGSDGIITEGASPSQNNDGVGFKAVYIRGLHEAFVRNPSNSDLRTLIHSYIDVQYNALLDLAANGDTYSSAWEGPAQDFTTWGQLAALDVLVSAIDTNS